MGGDNFMTNWFMSNIFLIKTLSLHIKEEIKENVLKQSGDLKKIAERLQKMVRSNNTLILYNF